MLSKAGSARRKTAATATKAARASGIKSATEDLQVRQRSNGAGGKYRVGGTDREKSVDESAEWGGEETEGLATEEEAETAGRGGGGWARH